jgi:hypothetical protein
MKRIQPEILMDKCILDTMWPVVLQLQEICELWIQTALAEVYVPSTKLHILFAAGNHFAVYCHLF